jgi:hypothetical protein
MVHRRDVDGETLVFGVHGALLGNAMTWWDHDSGSIWSQPTGTAVAGPRKGQRLELLPVSFTDWDSWLAAHPNTLALDAPAAATGFDLEDFLIVVDFTDDVVAYPVVDLQQAGAINDEVAGLEIAVVSDPADPQRWTVFSRRLDQRIVELAVDGDRLVDRETGTTWDPVTGMATDGELAGQVLDMLPALTSFPGDYDTFWPGGRVWEQQ